MYGTSICHYIQLLTNFQKQSVFCVSPSKINIIHSKAQVGLKPTQQAVVRMNATIMAYSSFFPRCVECRRGLVMRILSVRPSVRLSVRPSQAWIVTKQ